ncbi:MAG: F0F1 ATP synthase subunit A [Oscillospiraceae bacterium]
MMKITGAKILFTIPVLGGIKVSETIVNTWLVIMFLFVLIKVFTWRIERIPNGRQALAEKFVLSIENLVKENTGKAENKFTVYIGTFFLLSIMCSLSSLVGLRPPTADLATTFSWAAIVFLIIQISKIRTLGIKGYLKGFLSPAFIMLPFNIIGEVAVPISMAIRHFCNIFVGCVIGSLVGVFLTFLSTAILDNLGASVPIFKVGLPAVLSLYFDLFGSFIQAFVFIMLTMVFVGQAMETEE